LQDGKTLPNGPVVISPDGLFPSLYREGETLLMLEQLRLNMYCNFSLCSPTCDSWMI